MFCLLYCFTNYLAVTSSYLLTGINNVFVGKCKQSLRVETITLTNHTNSFKIQIEQQDHPSGVLQEGTSTDLKTSQMADWAIPAQQKRLSRKDDDEENHHNVSNGYRYSRKDDLEIDDGYRYPRQIDRTDSLLGGFNNLETSELPIHEPTGEKTRKTYDFTSTLTCRVTSGQSYKALYDRNL